MRIRKMAAIGLFVLVSAAGVAAPTVALAATAAPAAVSVVHPHLAGNPTCLASGSTCIRDANNLNTSGNPIVEGSNINGPAENMTYTAGQTLRFDGHPTLCVGLNSADTKAITQPCNGGHGIIFIEVGRGCCGAVAFINNAATQFFNTEEDLTAVNVNGDQMGVAAAGQGFQRFK